MATAALPRRWSTTTLVAVCTLVAAVGYLAGRLRPVGSDGLPHHGGPALDSAVLANAGRGEVARPAAAAPPDDLEARWQRISARGDTPAAERERAAVLTELAKTQPARAMALAEAEPNWRLRADLRDAVLRGWAETDPEAATQWALQLREPERGRAFAALLAGATVHPEQAIAAAVTACGKDPDREAEYGNALISAFAERGEFARAIRFVRERPASPLRLEQADTAFSTWASHQPQEAAAAAQTVDEPALQKAALHGVAVGWSMADPIAAANFGAQLTPGDARAEILANALPRWVESDPVAATAWLAEHEPHADFDAGVMAVATLPSMMRQRPDLAVTLAAGITDAPLRANTLRTLVMQWGEHDRAAAVHFLEASSRLSAEDRTTLLGCVAPPAGTQ